VAACPNEAARPFGSLLADAVWRVAGRTAEGSGTVRPPPALAEVSSGATAVLVVAGLGEHSEGNLLSVGSGRQKLP
jgi:hypothetical protein